MSILTNSEIVKSLVHVWYIIHNSIYKEKFFMLIFCLNLKLLLTKCTLFAFFCTLLTFQALELKAPTDPPQNVRFEIFQIPNGPISELLLPINDDLEVKREKVVLSDCVLGEGAFGLVRRATLYVSEDSSIDVAVKMLKG